jgi:formate/nitrite transporter FocA (FNT family)
MKDFFKVFNSAVLAGICISMGGTVFMKVGGLWGAVLFSFGLLTVVHYALKLYTGTAGFFNPKSTEEWIQLVVIILGNAVGCGLMSMLLWSTTPELIETSTQIVQKRLAAGWFNCFLAAICCGFIMTTAVNFARKKHLMPLLLGVPLFILCGFTHSIADAFYFLCSQEFFSGSVLIIWVSEILGNLVGCNLYRILIPKQPG